MKAFLLSILFPLVGFGATYQLPADRYLTNWYPAGLDMVGGIPTSFTGTNIVAGLHADGVTDDGVAIQTAIYAASSNTVVLVTNTGSVLIDGAAINTAFNGSTGQGQHLRIINGVVLRGAGGPCLPPYLPSANSSATTFVLANGADFFWRGSDKSSAWTPSGGQVGYGITNGYTQGSISIGVSNVTGISSGDYICIYENKDSAWVDDKGLTYLGEDSGPEPHVWAQYTQVTNKTGNALGFYPAIYQVTPSPVPFIRKQTFPIAMSGLENCRIDATGAGIKICWFQFCRNCWVKGVEIYNLPANSSGSPGIWTEFCYGNEYDRNYVHTGQGHDSGACYGIEFYHWNSRHKVENNIVRETRHSIVFEGGGSGCCILYNFVDSNWESVQGQPTVQDTNILSESLTINHGSHPYMNLWEGNSGENMESDYTQGSASHNTSFRNSLRGYRTGHNLTSAAWFWNLIEVQQYNRYESFIDNIIGSPQMTNTGPWAGGTIINNNSGGSLAQMYRFGVSSDGGTYQDSASYSTAILSGNYDFVSHSVHDWADASRSFINSYYYPSKPSFFGSLAWPAYDYSVTSAAGIDATNIPAGYLYATGQDISSGAQPPSWSVGAGLKMVPSAGLKMILSQ